MRAITLIELSGAAVGDPIERADWVTYFREIGSQKIVGLQLRLDCVERVGGVALVGTDCSILAITLRWSADHGMWNVSGKYESQNARNEVDAHALRSGSAAAGNSPISRPASDRAALRARARSLSAPYGSPSWGFVGSVVARVDEPGGVPNEVDVSGVAHAQPSASAVTTELPLADRLAQRRGAQEAAEFGGSQPPRVSCHGLIPSPARRRNARGSRSHPRLPVRRLPDPTSTQHCTGCARRRSRLRRPPRGARGTRTPGSTRRPHPPPRRCPAGY